MSPLAAAITHHTCAATTCRASGALEHAIAEQHLALAALAEHGPGDDSIRVVAVTRAVLYVQECRRVYVEAVIDAERASADREVGEILARWTPPIPR